MDVFRSDYNLKSNEYYFSKLGINNRFDSGEIIFIKRLLQVELDEELRSIIVDKLFKKYVSKDERSFSKELYMNVNLCPIPTAASALIIMDNMQIC